LLLRLARKSDVTTTLLRELADQTGLTQGRTAALIDTYKGPLAHLPGRVLDRVGTAQLELSGLPVPMLVLGCGSLAADLTSPIPLG
jgi:hypothetical protein